MSMKPMVPLTEAERKDKNFQAGVSDLKKLRNCGFDVRFANAAQSAMGLNFIWRDRDEDDLYKSGFAKALEKWEKDLNDEEEERRTAMIGKVPSIKKKKLSLFDHLQDAWKGEGNSKRITFAQWVIEMANNSRGTLQDAAKRYLKSKKVKKKKKRRK